MGEFSGKKFYGFSFENDPAFATNTRNFDFRFTRRELVDRAIKKVQSKEQKQRKEVPPCIGCPIRNTSRDRGCKAYKGQDRDDVETLMSVESKHQELEEEEKPRKAERKLSEVEIDELIEQARVLEEKRAQRAQQMQQLQALQEMDQHAHTNPHGHGHDYAIHYSYATHCPMLPHNHELPCGSAQAMAATTNPDCEFNEIDFSQRYEELLELHKMQEMEEMKIVECIKQRMLQHPEPPMFELQDYSNMESPDYDYGMKPYDDYDEVEDDDPSEKAMYGQSTDGKKLELAKPLIEDIRLPEPQWVEIDAKPAAELRTEAVVCEATDAASSGESCDDRSASKTTFVIGDHEGKLEGDPSNYLQHNQQQHDTRQYKQHQHERQQQQQDIQHKFALQQQQFMGEKQMHQRERQQMMENQLFVQQQQHQMFSQHQQMLSQHQQMLQQQQQQQEQQHENYDQQQYCAYDSDLEYEMARRHQYTNLCYPRPNVDEITEPSVGGGQARFIKVGPRIPDLNLNFLMNSAPMRYTDRTDEMSEDNGDKYIPAGAYEEMHQLPRAPSPKSHKGMASKSKIEKSEKLLNSGRSSDSSKSRRSKKRSKSHKKHSSRPVESTTTSEQIETAHRNMHDLELELKQICDSEERAKQLLMDLTLEQEALSKRISDGTSRRKSTRVRTSGKRTSPIKLHHSNPNSARRNAEPKQHNHSARQMATTSRSLDAPLTGRLRHRQLKPCKSLEELKYEKMKIFSKMTTMLETIIKTMDRLKMSILELRNDEMAHRLKHYKAALDFSVQFNRNFILPLKTMITEANGTSTAQYNSSKSNAACRRIGAIFKLILHALQTYKKHLRYFLIDRVPQKLNLLLEYIFTVTEICIKKEVFDKTDVVLECIQQRCTKFLGFIMEMQEERIQSAKNIELNNTERRYKKYELRMCKNELNMYEPKLVRKPPTSARSKNSKISRNGKTSKESAGAAGDSCHTGTAKGDEKKPNDRLFETRANMRERDATIQTQVARINASETSIHSQSMLLNNILSALPGMAKERQEDAADAACIGKPGDDENGLNAALVEALQSVAKEQVRQVVEPILHMLNSALNKKNTEVTNSTETEIDKNSSETKAKQLDEENFQIPSRVTGRKVVSQSCTELKSKACKSLKNAKSTEHQAQSETQIARNNAKTATTTTTATAAAVTKTTAAKPTASNNKNHNSQSVRTSSSSSIGKKKTAAIDDDILSRDNVEPSEAGGIVAVIDGAGVGGGDGDSAAANVQPEDTDADLIRLIDDVIRSEQELKLKKQKKPKKKQHDTKKENNNSVEGILTAIVGVLKSQEKPSKTDKPADKPLKTTKSTKDVTKHSKSTKAALQGILELQTRERETKQRTARSPRKPKSTTVKSQVKAQTARTGATASATGAATTAPKPPLVPQKKPEEQPSTSAAAAEDASPNSPRTEKRGQLLTTLRKAMRMNAPTRKPPTPHLARTARTLYNVASSVQFEGATSAQLTQSECSSMSSSSSPRYAPMVVSRKHPDNEPVPETIVHPLQTTRSLKLRSTSGATALHAPSVSQSHTERTNSQTARGIIAPKLFKKQRASLESTPPCPAVSPQGSDADLQTQHTVNSEIDESETISSDDNDEKDENVDNDDSDETDENYETDENDENTENDDNNDSESLTLGKKSQTSFMPGSSLSQTNYGYYPQMQEDALPHLRGRCISEVFSEMRRHESLNQIGNKFNNQLRPRQPTDNTAVFTHQHPVPDPKTNETVENETSHRNTGINKESLMRERDQFRSYCKKSRFYTNPLYAEPWKVFSSISNKIVGDIVDAIGEDFLLGVQKFVEDFLEKETLT